MPLSDAFRRRIGTQFPGALDALEDDLIEAGLVGEDDPLDDDELMVGADGVLSFRMATDPPGSLPERRWDPAGRRWV